MSAPKGSSAMSELTWDVAVGAFCKRVAVRGRLFLDRFARLEECAKSEAPGDRLRAVFF
ncbi:MAG: hypothetical protein Q7T87_18450 [Polaromonas sp.]|nr:hypothetical protein [Polaromonas sp.]